MTATGDRTPDVASGATADRKPPAALMTLVRVLRGTFGAFSLVGGLTWLLINQHAATPLADLMVGGVLAAGGLVLLMPHRVRLPRAVTAAAVGLAAAAGSLGSLAHEVTSTGGMFAYAAARGWPYPWVYRGGSAETPEMARSLALAADWQVDAVRLTADAVFWAYAGLLVVLVAVGVRRAVADRRATPGGTVSDRVGGRP